MTRFARYDKATHKRKRQGDKASNNVQSTEPVPKKVKNSEKASIDQLSGNGPDHKDYSKMVKGQIDSQENESTVKTESKSVEPIEEVKNDSTGNKFKENDYMTQYEGYWIRRSSLEHLTQIYRMKFDRLIDAREAPSEDKKLTPQEKITLNRLMKKEKRREHAILCKELRDGTCDMNKTRVFHSKYSYFDGFTVTTQGAEKLSLLREEMKGQGYTEDKIQEAMKRECRKEEKVYKKEKKQFCFACRETGHNLANCPESANSGICYKCGSDEHTSRSCPKGDKNTFAFATCFHCGKTGHLARECATNPRGLYPNGGECLSCGSINHLIKDCPKPMKMKKGDVRAEIRTDYGNIEAVEFDHLDDVEEEPKETVKAKKGIRVKEVFF